MVWIITTRYKTSFVCAIRIEAINLNRPNAACYDQSGANNWCGFWTFVSSCVCLFVCDLSTHLHMYIVHTDNLECQLWKRMIKNWQRQKALANRGADNLFVDNVQTGRFRPVSNRSPCLFARWPHLIVRMKESGDEKGEKVEKPKKKKNWKQINVGGRKRERELFSEMEKTRKINSNAIWN